MRVERDPGFWIAIAEHPVVAGMIGVFQRSDIAEVVGRADVTPLAFDHGGFWLFGRDTIGRAYELHTLFTPEGWGREVLSAGKELCGAVFERADLMFTLETEENRRSQPPRSFGWKCASPFSSSTLGSARTWVLTKDAWLQSPARRRACR